MDDKLQRQEERIVAVEKRLQETEVRLSLVQTWAQFLMKAYDALLHHKVNYKSLPQYKASPLEEAMDMPIRKARFKIVEWVRRLSNEIDARIRRKGFHVTGGNGKDDN